MTPTILATWSALYALGTVIAQASAERCGVDSTSRVVALVPALLSFAGALVVAWWNRPSKPTRRRRRS